MAGFAGTQKMLQQTTIRLVVLRCRATHRNVISSGMGIIPGTKRGIDVLAADERSAMDGLPTQAAIGPVETRGFFTPGERGRD